MSRRPIINSDHDYQFERRLDVPLSIFNDWMTQAREAGADRLADRMAFFGGRLSSPDHRLLCSRCGADMTRSHESCDGRPS